MGYTQFSTGTMVVKGRQDMVEIFATWGTMLAAIATAIATFFLWKVTRTLAVETKRMADASMQPQVVISIIPNAWSVIHLDIVVENTGNATAFDIEIALHPCLEPDGSHGERPAPFQNLSLIKPGERLSAYFSETKGTMKAKFIVTTTWKRRPADVERETLSYTLSIADYDGVKYLGGRDPVIQIADELKKFREEWKKSL